MLPKLNRLPGHLIPSTLNAKTTHHSPLFGLKVAPSNHPLPRIGFIVSSKIAKRAVDRNLLKRRLRQALYPHLKNLKPQHNLIFLAKHPLKIYLKPQRETPSNLQSHFLSTLKKAKLILNEKTSS